MWSQVWLREELQGRGHLAVSDRSLIDSKSILSLEKSIRAWNILGTQVKHLYVLLKNLGSPDHPFRLVNVRGARLALLLASWWWLGVCLPFLTRLARGRAESWQQLLVVFVSLCLCEGLALHSCNMPTSWFSIDGRISPPNICTLLTAMFYILSVMKREEMHSWRVAWDMTKQNIVSKLATSYDSVKYISDLNLEQYQRLPLGP